MPKRSERNPERRSPVPGVRTRSRFPWIFIALLLLIVACGVVGGAFVYVDRLVGAQLSRHGKAHLSAIYSDALELDTSASPDHLRDRLLRRRYQQVEGSPKVPGEFSYVDTPEARVFLITRPFIDSEGIERAPAHLEVPSFSTDGKPKHFVLEPQVLAALGDGEVRASEARPLSDFPKHLRQAVLAIEDERYYSHFGIDLIGIARAIFENLRAGRLTQGGSTVTQQLAKNLFFTQERTVKRKIMDMLAAVSLERRLAKDKILEMYLNEVYLGQEGSVSLHGFATAGRSFFGKDVKDLSISESALLAGMIQAPSSYSPRRHSAKAQERRGVVLSKMRELGFITNAQFEAADLEPVNVIKENLHRRRAPHFVMAVQKSLTESLNMEAATLQGVTVFTGLDPDLQDCAEQAINKTLPVLEKKFPKLTRRGKTREGLQVGLVSIEPFSGKIKAWVGGRDFNKDQFDHVSQARRQIGSTVKPFLYLTALDGNLNQYRVATAISILTDEPIELDSATQTWTPENFDHEYRGDVTLRYAVEHSLNIPAVQVVRRIGVSSLVSTLKSFGVAENIPPVPSLALGALDTTLENLTGGFAALANGGAFVKPRIYLSVVDAEGEAIDVKRAAEQRVASEPAVFVLTDILQGVVERGTAHSIRESGYQGPVAAKTGTSNETRDAWLEGFTPDLSTGVWVGYDDNRPIGLTGGQLAAPIWAEYMKCVSSFRTPERFVVPRGVIMVDIDPASGRRVTSACPEIRPVREVFVEGTEPTKTCGERRPEVREPESAQPEPEPERPRRRSFWDELFG